MKKVWFMDTGRWVTNGAFTLIRNEVRDLIASTGFAIITANKCSNEFLFQYCANEESHQNVL